MGATAPLTGLVALVANAAATVFRPLLKQNQ